jgi:hypothetical protein
VDVDVRVGPARGPLPTATYRWDIDTEILTATIPVTGETTGLSGSVGVEGADGSWVMFEVRGGAIDGIEIAVWPEVKMVPTLQAPEADAASVMIPARRSQPGIASVEVDTRLVAEADARESTLHFRFGAARAARAVRIADVVLLEIDEKEQVAGFWFLQVPPFPDVS